MIRGLTKPSIILLLTSFFAGQHQQEVSAFSLSSRRPKNHHHPASSIFKLYTSKNNNDDDFFDPFLHSPHDYPDGVDNGPEEGSSITAPNGGLGAIDEVFQRDDASSFGFSAISSEPSFSSSPPPNDNNNDDLFDPLLSPHAYPDGTNAGPLTTTSQIQSPPTVTKKLAILLIDHGSKREASNQHLQFIAETYQASIIQRDATTTTAEETSTIRSGRETIVRAAHMEIAEPSILTSLRNIITIDKATEIVCVPYFLSPGRHSTVDVPNLIAEAKEILGCEGLLQQCDDDDDGLVNILSSQALGTQLEFMLGGVDELVDMALKDGSN